MPFSITAQEISDLAQEPFTDFVSRLLRAERHMLGLPIGSVVVTDPPAMYTRDGGVDGTGAASTGASSEWLCAEGSVWQVKSGTIEPHKVAEELSKPGALANVRSGRKWCLALGKSLTAPHKEKLDHAAEEWFDRNRMPPNFLVLDAGELARWAEEHPALSSLGYFKRPAMGGLWRLDDDGQAFEDHQVPFCPDGEREDAMRQMHDYLEQARATEPLRIEGHAGVGKTRLALEALRASRWREHTLFCADARPLRLNIENLLAWVRMHASAKVAVIADECDYDMARRLAPYTASAPDRIRIVTIETDDTATRTRPAAPEVIPLDVLDDDAMRTLLAQAKPGLGRGAIEFIVEMCGGYVKLAVNLADAMARDYDRDPSAVELAKDYSLARLLGTLIPDASDRSAMEALSVLTRVGVHGAVADEGEVIAQFMGLAPQELLDAPRGARTRPFVSTAGRYRYVTPRLLAVWLANEVWQRRSEKTPSLLEVLPSPASRRSFLKRALDIGEEGTAERLARGFLGPDGPYAAVEALADPQLAQLLEVLVQLEPVAGLSCLERLLADLPRDELLQFGAGRREVIHALQRAAWFAECFYRAARLLFALAEAENEAWANNATGVWAGLFLTRLGATSTPAIERHRLLREALESNSVGRRLLAVKGIESALQTYEIGDTVGEVQGGKPVPPRWRPRSGEEVWAAWRSALGLLDQALADGNEEVKEAAIQVLLDSWRAVGQLGLADDVVGRLEAREFEDERHRGRLRDEIDLLFDQGGSELSTDIQGRLRDVRSRLEAGTFSQRLRRWAGPSGWRELRSEDGRKTAERELRAVAREAMAQPARLEAELPWLTSPEPPQAAFFGRLVGEQDRELNWLPPLRAEAQSNRGAAFVWGYLEGVSTHQGTAWLDNELDGWAASDDFPAAIVAAVTVGHGPSDRAVDRLARLREVSGAKDLALISLPAAWATQSRLPTLVALIDRVLLAAEPPAVRATAELLAHRLAQGGRADEELYPIMWRCIETPPESSWGHGMGEYYWREIATALVPLDPVRVAQAWVPAALSAGTYVHGDDDLSSVLVAATEASPREVWPIIARELMPGSMSVPLHLALQGWYGRHVPTEVLLEWARATPPHGPAVAAHVCPAEGHPLSDPARALLVAFNTPEVRSQLAANFGTGTFAGPYADLLQNELGIAQEWCKDPDPAVQRWAADVCSGLSDRLPRARQQDEEFDIE